MTAEKKDRKPLRIKNLADLKRHIRLGTELVATAHQYHPDIVGLMYEVGFGWDDHVRLRETLGRIKGKFLLSYNDCPEIRELYDGFSLFDFSRTHSMAQRYEAGKEFKELLIANYDYYERENAKPKQLTLFDIYGDENYDYEKILKESIISCKIR